MSWQKITAFFHLSSLTSLLCLLHTFTDAHRGRSTSCISCSHYTLREIKNGKLGGNFGEGCVCVRERGGMFICDQYTVCCSAERRINIVTSVQGCRMGALSCQQCAGVFLHLGAHLRLAFRVTPVGDTSTVAVSERRKVIIVEMEAKEPEKWWETVADWLIWRGKVAASSPQINIPDYVNIHMYRFQTGEGEDCTYSVFAMMPADGEGEMAASLVTMFPLSSCCF